jgi:hypothetical protein
MKNVVDHATATHMNVLNPDLIAEFRKLTTPDFRLGGS